MCNAYKIATDPRSIAEFFEADTFDEALTWPGWISAGKPGPVILEDSDGARTLQLSRFGLKHPEPRWARYPLNNAMIEKVEREPWARFIKTQHAILPLQAFQETCRWGSAAGKMVTLSPENQEFLGVASIFSEHAGEISAAMLIRPASKLIDSIGHCRMPFFLTREGCSAWLAAPRQDAEAWRPILRKHQYLPKVRFEVTREMKPGWDKTDAALRAFEERKRQSGDPAAKEWLESEDCLPSN